MVALLVGIVGALSVSMEQSMGWDEAMHLATPAGAVSLALKEGAFREALEVLLDCERYPPFVPALHGLIGALFDPSELLLRQLQRGLFGVAALGVFLLVRAVVAKDPEDDLPEGALVAPWLAVGLWVLSPLAVAFSGTLFLEVPFAALSTLAVAGWVQRTRRRSSRVEWWTGLALAACLFTKWNYGLLLGGALAVDHVLEGLGHLAHRRWRDLRRFGLATLRLGGPTALACLWWFVLPWPAGAETAATHREAVASFLAGNTELGRTASTRRWLDWLTFLVPSPRVLVWCALGAALCLRSAHERGMRVLLLVFLLAGVPVWSHAFHLERFLLPGAPFLFGLAALGVSPFLVRLGLPPLVSLVALLGSGFLFPAADSLAVLHALGLANPSKQDYQQAVMAERRSVLPSRPVPTSGLPREVHDALVSLLADLPDDGRRLGWLGLSQAFPPGAWGFGLLTRGESRERGEALLRARDLEERFLTLDNFDRGWTVEELEAWSAGFGRILSTQPIDLVSSRRDWLGPLRAQLIERGGFEQRVLGTVRVPRPEGVVREVQVGELVPRSR